MLQLLAHLYCQPSFANACRELVSFLDFNVLYDNVMSVVDVMHPIALAARFAQPICVALVLGHEHRHPSPRFSR